MNFKLYPLAVSFFISISAVAQQEVQVDPLTGRAIFSVPIGQVSIGSISSSVAIAYNGGGVQIKGGGGTAGTGFDLVAGGGIYRLLRGLPDEYNDSNDARKGWLNSSNRSALSSFAPSNDTGCTDWSSFSTFNNLSDTEPDIFIISAPGLSGRFVYDNGGTLRVMPYQDLKITAITGGYEITNNQGIKYVFNLSQNTTRVAQDVYGGTPIDRTYNQFAESGDITSIPFVSAYLLTSIQGPAGEEITFIYSAPVNFNSRDNVDFVNVGQTNVETRYYIEDHTDQYFLDSIKSVNGKSIAINWSGNIVSNIVVASSGVSHTFLLGYSRKVKAGEVSVNTGVSGARMYLSSLTEIFECNAFPSYTFEYHYPDSLPTKLFYPVDFFGYYNGATVGTEGLMLIPSIYQNTSASDGERLRIYSKSGYTTISSSTKRNVNGAKSYYGSLKKITFPMGGFNEIYYEPNEYYDEATSSDALGAGVRVDSLVISDGDSDNTNNIIRTFQYKKSNNSSSGHWLYSPSFGIQAAGGLYISPDNLAPDQTILYERSTVLYPGNGKTVSEFLVPGVYPATSTTGWNATKSRSVAQNTGSCPDNGSIAAGYYSYPYGQNTNFDFAQGLISKVQFYNQGDTLLKEQKYYYQNLGPTATTIKAMKVETSGSVYYYGLYSLQASTTKTIQTDSTIVYDMVAVANKIKSSKGYTFNGNYLLSEIATTNSDGKVHKVNYKYANDYTVSSPSGVHATSIKKLNDLNMHATPIEVVSLVDSEVTAASLTLFYDWGTSHVYPKKQLIYSGNSTFTYATTSSSPHIFSYDSDYVLSDSIESYNSVGMPLSSVGLNKSISGVIYGSDKSTPVASIAGARPSEIVFSDFENGAGYQIDISNSTVPWSGEKSYQITAAGNISKDSVIKTVAPNYRFRCRAKASGSGSLTLSLTHASSGWVTSMVNYGTVDQWVLLEALVSMSNVASLFTFKITANTNNVIVDDIVFYPENSAVQSMTYKPFAGKTSVTDNRGYSAFYEHDNFQRLHTVKNTDKNIRQWHEYQYKNPTTFLPRASFTCSGCDVLYTGYSATFTAHGSDCFSGFTYAWSVNGTSAGTSSTLTYTFSSCREYEISLTVTNTVNGSATASQKYFVAPVPLAASAQCSGGTCAELECDNGAGNGTRTVSVNSVTGCGSAGTLTYEWYFKKDNGSWVAIASSNSSSIAKDCYYQGPMVNYVYFKCKITTSCGDGVFNAPVEVFTNEVAIHKIYYNPPCPN